MMQKTEEIDAMMQIVFTPPKNVIDFSCHIYLTDDNDDIIYDIPLNMEGDY